jgi:hypothetical protein
MYPAAVWVPARLKLSPVVQHQYQCIPCCPGFSSDKLQAGYWNNETATHILHTILFFKCAQITVKLHIVRFEVFTAVRMMMFFFWVLAPCRLDGWCQRFRETYCLHLQHWRQRQMEMFASTVESTRCQNPEEQHYQITYYFKFAPAIACIWHKFYLEILHFR